MAARINEDAPRPAVDARPAGAGRPVGIDDLNVDGGTLAIDSAVIAAARGLSNRDLRAAGFRRRSVLPPYEDAVTLAVNAARPLVEAGGRDRFELLIVATESGFDYGKPLSSYIHRWLGITPRCRNFEIKHACYAGTAALQMAVAWVRSGVSPESKALVVMTDVARRHVGDPAELTAGSGALALTVSAEPRVLEIEPVSGYACREVYDVARPTQHGEWGDAVLSVAAYLDLLEEAWSAYGRAAGTTQNIDERFEYVLYHTPLVSLVHDAHRVLLESDGADLTADAVRASFDRAVRPALGFASELANIYSGSAYCLLAGLLDGDAPIPPRTRVGVCSYGSGSCAEVFGGIVMDTARPLVRQKEIARRLAERASVDITLYEKLVGEVERVNVAREYRPDRDFVPGHFERSYAGFRRLVLLGIKNHHRRYGWSDDSGSPV